MGILKFGVIGFLIICPFMYVSMINTLGDTYEYQQLTRIEKSIEEASNDAAFVMKTYSQAAFDSHDEYNIVVPREDVVQVFFDSLNFRDFMYSKADFPMIIFVEYDGVVVYNSKEDLFYPKVFYSYENINGVHIANLAHEVKVIDATSLSTIETKIDHDLAEKIILQTLEETLNRVCLSLELNNEFVFELPEVDHNFYSPAVNDLSFIAFYSNSEYYGLGQLNVLEIKPSGIMKMNSLLPIDI